MIRLMIFILVLLALSVTDIAILLKEGLKREIIPYAALAAAALVAAAALFTGPMRESLISAAQGLFGAG